MGRYKQNSGNLHAQVCQHMHPKVPTPNPYGGPGPTPPMEQAYILRGHTVC